MRSGVGTCSPVSPPDISGFSEKKLKMNIAMANAMNAKAVPFILFVVAPIIIPIIIPTRTAQIKGIIKLIGTILSIIPPN